MTLVSSRHVLVMSLRMVSAWQGSVTQRGQHSFSGRTLNSQSTSGHGKGQQSTSPCCLQKEQDIIISSSRSFPWISIMFPSWLVFFHLLLFRIQHRKHWYSLTVGHAADQTFFSACHSGRILDLTSVHSPSSCSWKFSIEVKQYRIVACPCEALPLQGTEVVTWLHCKSAPKSPVSPSSYS